MPWLAVAAAYLLGSLPFGLLLARLAGKDIRAEGSGNIGATNVMRVCGARWGVPVLLLDGLKGFVPVFWIAPALGAAGWLPILTGVAAILGHNFPVWLGFRGGKGVATSAGVVLALLPGPFGVALLVFLLVVATTRYVSLGSMSASVALVLAHLLLAPTPFDAATRPVTVLAALLCALVLLRHRANIRRLLDGTENKIFKPKATSGTAGDARPNEEAPPSPEYGDAPPPPEDAPPTADAKEDAS